MLIKLTAAESQTAIVIESEDVRQIVDVSAQPYYAQRGGRSIVSRERYADILAAETVEQVMARIQGKPAGQAARTAPGAVPMRP